ncbi:hypothetical protein BH11MYX1_BH11MYX1_52100 [soil metagenome]
MATPTDRTKVVPYVVPSTYPLPGNGWSRPLGHDIHAILSLEYDRLVTGMGPADFKQLQFGSVEECWETALTNLDEVFASRTRSTMFPEPPEGVPFILTGDSWLAASCIVLPRFRGWASKLLGTDALLVSIPNPEALLTFPKGTRAQRQAMRSKIRDAERGHRKLITWELFELSDTGIRPFDDLES